MRYCACATFLACARRSRCGITKRRQLYKHTSLFCSLNVFHTHTFSSKPHATLASTLYSDSGSSDPDSLVSNVKLGVEDADESVSQDPEGVGQIETLETTQTERLTALRYLQYRERYNKHILYVILSRENDRKA